MLKDEGLPKTGEAQEIGHEAVTCLYATKPKSWLPKDLGGTDDYGLDYQIQLNIEGQVRGIFRVQLKGTRSPVLSADGSFISMELSASTLRYYDEISEPILLVVCDLSVDEESSNCPMYYTWVRPELRRIDIENVARTQKEVTLRVPTANRVLKSTDLLGDIREAKNLAEVGHALDMRVADVEPSMDSASRLGVVKNVENWLSGRSATFFQAVKESPDTDWVNPPKGSLPWHLQEGTRLIRAGKLEGVGKELDACEAMLNDATPNDQAEFWYLSGRLHSSLSRNTEARDSFLKATQLGTKDQFWTSYAESEIRARFEIDGANDFSDVIAALPSDKPIFLATKARLLAASNRYPEAIALLDSSDTIDSLSSRAVLETMAGHPQAALDASLKGLDHPDSNDSTRQVFLVMKARARFGLAVEDRSLGARDQILPPAGTPGMNFDLLKTAWADINEAVDAMSEAGWSANSEFVADIWASAAAMLGKQKEIFSVITAAAKLRPHLPTLQASAEIVCAQCGDFKSALVFNTRTEDSSTKALRRTAFLHEDGQHKACIDYFSSIVDSVDKNHQLFGSVLTSAAESAHALAKSDLARNWADLLDGSAELLAHKAVLNYFLRKDAKLDDGSALATLEREYDAQGAPLPIALTLFQELDPTDIKQAPRCVAIASRIKEWSQLSIQGAVHFGMALVTLNEWSDLLKMCEESGRQFEGTSRLKALQGLALDKLGRTEEARTLLAEMIGGGISDSVALKTYVNIMVRCGFVAEATDAAEKILEAAKSPTVKIDCLRLLFSIVQMADPSSQRLIELTMRMGELVDQKNEVQEGIFLTMFLTSTSVGNASPTKSQVTEFQARIQTFVGLFPDSKILKSATTCEDATADELLASIKATIGITDDQIAFQTKIENQLQSGTLPMPYAWRPKHALVNVHDVVQLWEIAKRSRGDDRKFHLFMMGEGWQAASLAKARSLTPLVDLIALLVISDLGLIENLFKFFPAVAISQQTLVDLSNLTHNFSGSPWRGRCKALQDELKAYLGQIVQPSIALNEDDKHLRMGRATEEIKQLCQTGAYQLYSDDGIFRLYASGADGAPQGLCTGDLLALLEETGQITLREAAEKIATLCSWHVGLSIALRYQLAIVPDAVLSARNILQGVELLQKDDLFMAMATAMWDVRSDFEKMFHHIGAVLRDVVARHEIPTVAVASFVGVWYIKAKLRGHSPFLIIAGMVSYAAVSGPPLDDESSRRLIAVFRNLLELEFGSRMDEQREREGITLLAQECARLDDELSSSEVRSKDRLLKGFTAGTSDADLFSSSYSTRMIELGIQKSKKLAAQG